MKVLSSVDSSRSKSRASNAASAESASDGQRSRARIPGVSSALALLALAPLLGSCCLLVRPPDARELLSTGFRSPEQTFRTFQIGWRANEPDLERRCFSQGFRERNRVSRLNYREFRERLVAEQPLLRLGIADAQVDGPAEVREGQAVLRATSHGRHLVLHLVLDDFAEVFAGEERVLDESIEFSQHIHHRTEADGTERLWGYVDLPPDLPKDSGARTISELRLGREWKIDDLQLIDDP